MIILTTLYNCDQYIERCLGSIIGQDYKDFKCYITDDLSTDKSVDVVKDIIKDDDRFILIKNKTKMYQPGNYDQIIRGDYDVKDNEVCIEVDGDDWLPNPSVLGKVATIYDDNNIWITNGSFGYSTGANGFSSKQEITPNLRKSRMTCSHLRTWRAFLWREIKVDDLKDENGDYWKVTGDLAFMFPMLEMAADEHYLFVNEQLYTYNETNPLNDHKVDLGLVNDVATKIRNKEPYKKLKK